LVVVAPLIPELDDVLGEHAYAQRPAGEVFFIEHCEKRQAGMVKTGRVVVGGQLAGGVRFHPRLVDEPVPFAVNVEVTRADRLIGKPASLGGRNDAQQMRRGH
jgi:hypothetical protein